MEQVITFDQRLLMMAQLQNKVRQLEEELARERATNIESPVKKKRASPKEVLEYSEFKSDGHRKATRAQPVNSYEDIEKISNWFLEHKQYRNWALWRCGIAFGLRFSDLVSLKWKQILSPAGTYFERIHPIERKTHKLHDCLITEAVRKTLSEYISRTGNQCFPDSYVFSSMTKGKGDGTTPITTSQGCKILKEAGDECNLDFHLSTHTMRKSMVNIAMCVGKNKIDPEKWSIAAALLNHSSTRTSMLYLDKMRDVCDSFREVVSDFILGKTVEKKLVWDDGPTLDDIYSRVDALSDKIESLCQGSPEMKAGDVY